MVVMLVSIVLFSVIKFDSLGFQLSGAHRADAGRRRSLVRNHSPVSEKRKRLVLQTDDATGRLAAKHHDARNRTI